jgi:hypothetical protein
MVTFSSGTPLFLNKFVQAIAEAPAPFTTTLISFIDLPVISKALSYDEVFIISVTF